MLPDNDSILRQIKKKSLDEEFQYFSVGNSFSSDISINAKPLEKEKDERVLMELDFDSELEDDDPTNPYSVSNMKKMCIDHSTKESSPV